MWPKRDLRRGVEAWVLAILYGHHAFYKVGKHLEERGIVPQQPGLTWASLPDYRLGHILDALFVANLNKVLSAVALKALAPSGYHDDSITRGRRRQDHTGPRHVVEGG